MNYRIVRSSLHELREKATRAKNKYWPDYVFIHINKTAGSSIERALGLCFEHKTARQKRDELGTVRWRKAFKFAFVRNPWDKVISHYHFRVRTNQTGMGGGQISFSDWIRAAYRDRDPRYYDKPLMFAPQADWLTDESGNLIVDFIGRFETLSEDFAALSKVLGTSAQLPHLKPSVHIDFRNYYDAETRLVIAEHFRTDCSMFGYTASS